MEKTKFWEDSPGSQSSGRLIFIIGSIWNMIMTTILIFKGVDPIAILGFFSGVEGVFGGLKLVQKGQENSVNSKIKQ